MIRILNFVCVALMGLSILALYHVSEATRVSQMRLSQVSRKITDTKTSIGVLQAEWERVAGPARIQALAEANGMSDSSSAQLSSFEQLPARGSEVIGDSPVRNASAEAAPVAAPHRLGL
jgi:cell division protein FtsL